MKDSCIYAALRKDMATNELYIRCEHFVITDLSPHPLALRLACSPLKI